MRKNPQKDSDFTTKDEQIEALKHAVDELMEFMINTAVDKEFDQARDRLFIELGLESKEG